MRHSQNKPQVINMLLDERHSAAQKTADIQSRLAAKFGQNVPKYTVSVINNTAKVYISQK